MTKSEQEIRYGIEAERVLTNPAYARAWAHVEHSILAQMKALRFDDPQRDIKRDRLFSMIQLLDKLRISLEQTMKTGEMAEMQEKKPTIAERFQRFVA